MNIEELRARRDELQIEIAQLHDNATAARRAAVEGGDVGALAALEARKSALSQVLSDVRRDLAPLEAEEAAAADNAEREAQIARLGQLAEDATHLRAAIEERIIRLHQSLVQGCREVTALRHQLAGAQIECKGILESPEPVPYILRPRDVEAQRRGFDMAAVKPARLDLEFPSGLLLGLRLDESIRHVANADMNSKETQAR
jgi:hypothetical protein